ncbi:MAG: hypothetical protein E6230_00265 [Paenibacillus dendritiformis]|uniref:hypothetical protein n=1 Tax=Paenibacillus dendritiformis TaxID=130049 RepID=UPI001B298DA8|nr:hypothetical protein [Paenibacillus dendritiformis]MDU5140600.1 hypothetical protein [Paenibacillus dendritiformis]GIO70908.1 hypothetical protein J27TS7_04220 [Paenibacillus dendritiformis]
MEGWQGFLRPYEYSPLGSGTMDTNRSRLLNRASPGLKLVSSLPFRTTGIGRERAG